MGSANPRDDLAAIRFRLRSSAATPRGPAGNAACRATTLMYQLREMTLRVCSLRARRARWGDDGGVARTVCQSRSASSSQLRRSSIFSLAVCGGSSFRPGRRARHRHDARGTHRPPDHVNRESSGIAPGAVPRAPGLDPTARRARAPRPRPIPEASPRAEASPPRPRRGCRRRRRRRLGRRRRVIRRGDVRRGGRRRPAQARGRGQGQPAGQASDLDGGCGEG